MSEENMRTWNWPTVVISCVSIIAGVVLVVLERVEVGVPLLAFATGAAFLPSALRGDR